MAEEETSLGRVRRRNVREQSPVRRLHPTSWPSKPQVYVTCLQKYGSQRRYVLLDVDARNHLEEGEASAGADLQGEAGSEREFVAEGQQIRASVVGEYRLAVFGDIIC